MAITAGEMRYTVEGKEHDAVVGCGFAEITNDKVIVITDFAQKPEEIDIERAERAKVRAEERLREKESQIEFAPFPGRTGAGHGPPESCEEKAQRPELNRGICCGTRSE